MNMGRAHFTNIGPTCGATALAAQQQSCTNATTTKSHIANGLDGLSYIGHRDDESARCARLKYDVLEEVYNAPPWCSAGLGEVCVRGHLVASFFLEAWSFLHTI